VVLWGTVVGKKVVVAVTGLGMVGFVIADTFGNRQTRTSAEAPTHHGKPNRLGS
jgi:hypothetical protein